MPFLLAEILNFQGSTHRIGVGSFSKLEEAKENKNKELFEKEKEKIIEYEKQIQKLRRKLG